MRKKIKKIQKIVKISVTNNPFYSIKLGILQSKNEEQRKGKK
jgi:hypothetical protein